MKVKGKKKSQPTNFGEKKMVQINCTKTFSCLKFTIFDSIQVSDILVDVRAHKFISVRDEQ